MAINNCFSNLSTQKKIFYIIYILAVINNYLVNFLLKFIIYN